MPPFHRIHVGGQAR